MDESRFSSEEIATWIAFASVLEWLPTTLDAELQEVAQLSHFEYQVLSRLAETTDGLMRMSDLAAFANSSLSRLSHSVKRLESRGFMTRTPDPENGRYTLAHLSEAGWQKTKDTAPLYVDVVRKLVFEVLTKQQTRAMGEASKRIMNAIDPSHDCGTPSMWVSTVGEPGDQAQESAQEQ